MMADDKRSVAGIAVFALGIILVFPAVSAWSRTHPAGAGGDVDQSAPWAMAVNHALHSSDSVVRQRAEDGLVEQAQSIRGHWSHWAESHRALLMTICAGGRTDQATVAGYYRALPASVSLGAPGCVHFADLISEQGVFTWNCAPLDSDYWNPNAPVYTATWAKEVRADELSSYAEHHDIVISQSVTTGSTVRLWASGRITVGYAGGSKGETRDGLGRIVYGGEREVVGRFGFLSPTAPVGGHLPDVGKGGRRLSLVFAKWRVPIAIIIEKT